VVASVETSSVVASVETSSVVASVETSSVRILNNLDKPKIKRLESQII
jgi:hypothetical protein